MSPVRIELKSLGWLALPIIATNLGTMLLGVVDVWMVARYSSEALASATLANTWIHGTTLFAMGIVMGIDPIVSQAHGARDGLRGGLALQRGIVVALLVSVPIAWLWSHCEGFLLLAGQQPELADAAQTYALVQIPSAPLFLVFIAMRQYLQGRGIVRPALWVVLGTNVLNVIFNAALIFGRFGFPEMGLQGAGIATALSKAIMLIGLLAIVRGKRLHRGAWTPWTWRAVAPRGLMEVFRFGIPTGIQMALEIWAFAAAALMAGLLGTVPLAAHAIVLNVASVSFMIPMGISFAAVTHVGNLIGQGLFERAQRAAWVACAMGGAVMSISGICFLVFRHHLPALFTDDPEILVLCAAVFPIAAAFQVFDGVQVVGAGVLRGMGRTLPAACFNLVGYWMLSLPMGWWLAFHGGQELRGIWWGLALGLAIVAVLMLAWIRVRGPATLRAGATRLATR
ncbi:MAG: MATE family multidrug resistance protein [Chlamydiales bacterium]|jgi:MATE family multidrug resistance protein